MTLRNKTQYSYLAVSITILKAGIKIKLNQINLICEVSDFCPKHFLQPLSTILFKFLHLWSSNASAYLNSYIVLNTIYGYRNFWRKIALEKVLSLNAIQTMPKFFNTLYVSFRNVKASSAIPIILSLSKLFEDSYQINVFLINFDWI